MSATERCERCRREQPAPFSPCPQCDGFRAEMGIGAYSLEVDHALERPITIMGPGGERTFSFDSWDINLAQDIVRNLNTMARNWRDAA